MSASPLTILLRWSAALAWTALTVFLMLSPGEQSTAEDLSRFFGGTDLTDALGHVFLFGILTALWWWTLMEHLPLPHALRAAVAVGLTTGIVTELARFFIPHWGVALIDLVANGIGVLLPPTILRLLAGNRAFDLIP